MAWVTSEFIETWKSKRYLGASRPTAVVQVRRGNFRRDYRSGAPSIPGATIPGEDDLEPWFPIFTETTPWVTVPNVSSINFSKDFSQRGMNVATIQLDNVGYVEETGPLGDVYHLIKHGFMAPSRGYVAPTRGDGGVEQNEWFDVLTENADIRIWQGFGAPELDEDGNPPLDGGVNGAWTFHGLIDTSEPNSSPPTITITARSGKVLTDSRIFGWNKSKQLKDPVTFCDREEALLISYVGDSATASSERSSTLAPATNVTDDDSAAQKTWWLSEATTGREYTEWVEIHVPAGTYSHIALDCDAGMELFVGFFPRSDTDTLAQVDGFAVPEAFYGSDIVPGDNGGWAYLYHQDYTLAGRRVIDLGHEIICGNDSIIRCGFRRLAESADSDPASTTPYRARVRSLQGRSQQLSADAVDSNWILVDDISDMVAVCARWAGFSEWDIQPTGVRLKGKAVFNRSNFLIDPMVRATELTGYVLFLADPTNGESLGVLTFRQNASLYRTGIQLTEVTDHDLLTDLKARRGDENLAYIIRWRGRESKRGTTLGGETARRIMAVYRPPWTEDDTSAGVIKHQTRTDNALRSIIECEVACYLTAIAEALAAFTAAAVIPGYPALELDDQIGVTDTATGVNTRVWVTGLQSSWKGGTKPEWTTSFTGSMIDTADLVQVIEDIDALDFSPFVSPHAPLIARIPRIR